jgi:hypothetical protein
MPGSKVKVLHMTACVSSVIAITGWLQLPSSFSRKYILFLRSIQCSSSCCWYGCETNDRCIITRSIRTYSALERSRYQLTVQY